MNKILFLTLSVMGMAFAAPSDIVLERKQPLGEKNAYAGLTMFGPVIGISALTKENVELALEGGPFMIGGSVSKIRFVDPSRKTSNAYLGFGGGFGVSLQQNDRWIPSMNGGFKGFVGIRSEEVFIEVGGCSCVIMDRYEKNLIPWPTFRFGVTF